MKLFFENVYEENTFGKMFKTPYVTLYINMHCAYNIVLYQNRGKSRRVDKRKIMINV